MRFLKVPDLDYCKSKCEVIMNHLHIFLIADDKIYFSYSADKPAVINYPNLLVAELLVHIGKEINGWIIALPIKPFNERVESRLPGNRNNKNKVNKRINKRGIEILREQVII